jgi:Sulfotransferase domain
MALKAIGAGLGRTGTMSLKAALEQLGLGPCYHRVKCLPRGPEHWRKWIDAAGGKPDWNTLFDGFDQPSTFLRVRATRRSPLTTPMPKSS